MAYKLIDAAQARCAPSTYSRLRDSHVQHSPNGLDSVGDHSFSDGGSRDNVRHVERGNRRKVAQHPRVVGCTSAIRMTAPAVQSMTAGAGFTRLYCAPISVC